MTGVFQSLTGQIFGRWTVIRRLENTAQGKAVWLCRCSCDGKESKVGSYDLTAGTSQSCGCISREKASARAITRNANQQGKNNRNFKHGHTSGKCSSIYSTWAGVVARCTCPNASHWDYYGGANPPVCVCERWRVFENFLADLGTKPTPQHSLGRFGDVGNYSCGGCEECKRNNWERNCAWQTVAQQRLEQKIKRWNQQLQAA
jgi:hypothetical protein